MAGYLVDYVGMEKHRLLVILLFEVLYRTHR